MKNNELLFARTQRAVELYAKYQDEKKLSSLYELTISSENMYFLALAIVTKKAIDIYSTAKTSSVNFENEMYHLKNSCFAIRFDEDFNIIDNYHVVTTAVDMIQDVVTVLCTCIGKTLLDEVEYNNKKRIIKNICYDVARKSATLSNGYREVDENYITENGKRAHRKMLIKNISLDTLVTAENTDENDVLVYIEQNIDDYASAITIRNARREIKDVIDRKIFDMLLFVDYSLEDIGRELCISKQAVQQRIKRFSEKYPRAIDILKHKA